MADFRFVVFQSVFNNKYLRLTNGKDVGLSFNGGDIADPATKFELEPAKSADAKWIGLKHIRSCYNNKYLVRDVVDDSKCIAGADKPEEDLSKPSCTLFKPEQRGNQLTYGFQHVQTGKYTCLWETTPPIMYLGTESSPDNKPRYLYTLVDWDDLVFFPQRVAFKGNNGKYLCLRDILGFSFLQYAENTRDETAEYEVTTIGNGQVHIMSLQNGKFWEQGNNWISATSSGNSVTPDELFWPVKVGDNVVALQNMGNMYFCRSLTAGNVIDCLNCGTRLISSIAEMVVEDAVVSRHIYNINFDLSNSRIYDESLIPLATQSATNGSNEKNTLMLKLVFKDIKTNTLNNNISLKMGAKTTIKIDAIPLIDDEGKVTLSAEITDGFQWGETRRTENDVESSYTVNVNPSTKTTVTLQAMKGSCDVPFSYTQSETFSNGESSVKTMSDGVFTGANYFDTNFVEKHQKL